MCTALAVMVCPQVLSDVMGEEFEIFMEMLSKLQFPINRYGPQFLDFDYMEFKSGGGGGG